MVHVAVAVALAATVLGLASSASAHNATTIFTGSDPSSAAVFEPQPLAASSDRRGGADQGHVVMPPRSRWRGVTVPAGADPLDAARVPSQDVSSNVRRRRLRGTPSSEETPAEAGPVAGGAEAGAGGEWEVLPDTVLTRLGYVQGNVTDRARSFRGIPYAQPPTNVCRWSSPTVALPWFPETLPAFEDPNACLQRCDLPEALCPTTQSEDCLYLSVFTPALAPLHNTSVDAPSEPGGLRNHTHLELAPVMVYLHGGMFRSGHGTGPVFDGSRLANTTGAVVITIQYRLGALGFMLTRNFGVGGDSYCGEVPERWRGRSDFGIQDQTLALEWVQYNAAAFGGDPTRVTIVGQGAGAMSAAVHMMSPDANWLYHRAILQSPSLALPMRNHTQALAMANAFVSFADCPTSHPAECLLRLSAEEVLDAQAAAEADVFVDLTELLQVFMPWSPIVGEPGLGEQPLLAIQRGAHHSVPMMIGSVADEGFELVYEAFQAPLSLEEYTIVESAVFGASRAVRINSRYPLAPTHPMDARPTNARVIGDSVFLCPTRNASVAAVDHATDGPQPTFSYMFNHSWSFGSAWGANYSFCWDKSCHYADVPFVFGAPPNGTAAISFTPDERKLSDSMMTFWGSFADKGVPEDVRGGSPAWPDLQNGTVTSMVLLSTGNVVEHDLLGTRCALWDDMGYPGVSY